MRDIDSDLLDMLPDEALREVMRLRKGIREHRDVRGHNRCWVNDEILYALLPEKKKAVFALPPREEFIGNCDNYWHDRQRPESRRMQSGPLRRVKFALGRALGLV